MLLFSVSKCIERDFVNEIIPTLLVSNLHSEKYPRGESQRKLHFRLYDMKENQGTSEVNHVMT